MRRREWQTDQVEERKRKKEREERRTGKKKKDRHINVPQTNFLTFWLFS